jgi:hypothetical protein
MRERFLLFQFVLLARNLTCRCPASNAARHANALQLLLPRMRSALHRDSSLALWHFPSLCYGPEIC